MAIQTTVDFSPVKGQAGLLYGLHAYYEIITVTSDVDLYFGEHVSKVSIDSNNLIKVGKTTEASTAVNQMGFVLMNRLEDLSAKNFSRTVESPETFYQAGSLVPVLVRGKLWVNTEVAVTSGETLNIRYVDDLPLTIGGYRGSAVTDETFQLAKTATFINSNTAAGLAILNVF